MCTGSSALPEDSVAGAVGRGTVQWSDPVAKYLPGFTLSDPYVGTHVTIADMYAHRSGLPGQAGDLLEDLGYDRTAIIARLALEPLDPFRTVYHYANFGLTAGGEAVAKAAGTTWEDLSQDVLYGPRGMTSTSSRFSDYRKALNRALLHVRVGSRWLAGMLAGVVFAVAYRRRGLLLDAMVAHGAANVVLAVAAVAAQRPSLLS